MLDAIAWTFAVVEGVPPAAATIPCVARGATEDKRATTDKSRHVFMLRRVRWGQESVAESMPRLDRKRGDKKTIHFAVLTPS